MFVALYQQQVLVHLLAQGVQCIDASVDFL